MLNVAFGESTISRTQVQLWYNRFKEGREVVNDYACPGRWNTSTTYEAMKKMILNYRQIMIREFADDVGILLGSCQAIFTDVLGMKSAKVKIVPKLLNFEQNQRCMNIAQEMLTMFNNNPDLLKKVVTADESLVYSYDIEIKAQLSQWKRLG